MAHVARVISRPRDLRAVGWWVLGLGAAADIVLLLPLGPIEPPLALHHVEHGLLMLVGGAFAVRVGRLSSPEDNGSPLWLVAALLLSLVTVVGMVPDFYDYVDAHPVAHAALHLGFVAVSFATVYAAQRYARALGPLWLWTYVVMTVVAVTGFGFQRAA